MATEDQCCSIVPYFKVNAGKLDEFKELTRRFVDTTRSEPKCLYYGFCFDGAEAHCREGYEDAEGVLAHLGNVDALLKEAFEISSITRLEIHGPADQLEQLKGPLEGLSPQYFVLERGFRK